MNSFERYIGMLNGGAVDILPRTPILMQYAAEYIGTDYGSFASDHKVLVEANRKCALDFEFDQLSCISDPYRETEGFGGEITYHKDGPPWSTHPLEFTRDLSILKNPNPMKSERMLDRINAVRAYKNEFFKVYSVLGWVEGPIAEAADLRGITNFLMDLIEDPIYADELMDKCLETAIAFAVAQVEAGADTIGIGDALASQVSPGIYESLIQPKEKILANEIKKAGGLVKLHICGNITHLLPSIADLQVDILDIDHLVDMTLARETVGDKVTITGNLDPVSEIKNGNPESIKSGIKKIYEQVGNPFMVNAGCEIPPGTPIENLKALCSPVPYKH